MQFTHVLFPFDYSTHARSAAKSVKSLVQKVGAKLTILNVISDPCATYPANAPFLVPQSERDAIVKASVGFLREYTSEAFEGYSADTVVHMGDPAREIIRFATENNVDLIMMPTVGCGSFRRLLLGSIAAKVLDEAECPVWTEAHALNDKNVPEPEKQTVLCAVDENRESISIMRCGQDIADLYAAELYLIHAIPEIDPGLKMLRPEWAVEYREFAKSKIIQKRAAAGINGSICVQEGDVSIVVRQAAIAYKSRVVVIGRGHRQGFLGRLRSNAYSIIRDSPCPVLSI